MRNGLIDEARGFVDGLAAGDAVGAAVAVGLVSLALILALQRWLPRVPGVLVAVVVAIGAAAAFDLSDHGVSLVGTLPAGLPVRSRWPSPVSDLPLLVAGALGIALVSLTDTISTASAFAARTGQEVDGNGEMIGIGAANVGAGLFQGFPVSTSGSRTAVAEQAGAKTQLTGLVGAATIVLMLVLVPGLLRNLPQPDARRGGDRRVAVAGRRGRDGPAVASAPRRVPALDDGVPGRGPARRARRASPSRSRSRSSTSSGARGGPTRRPSGASPGCRATTTAVSIPTPRSCPAW